jgi:hypothetical protein
VGVLHIKKTAANTRLAIDGDAGFNKLISYRTAGLQRFGLYVNNTAESGSNAGSNFAIRAYNDAGTLLHTPLSIERATGQVTFTERVNVEADSLVTTQSSSVIAASTTNANLVIAPNGTGALIASIPDGTATGGNARGNNAVDLQISRTAATQVASRANSVIVGGSENAITGTEFQGAIVGGAANTVSNRRGFVGGGYGNNNSGWHGTIGGGQENTLSGTHGSIIGGLSNTVSGEYSVVSGGRSNTSSSNYSTVSGGQTNTASTNTHATVIGGQGNTSSGLYSVSGGSNSTASGDRSFAIGESALALGVKSVCLLGGSAQAESSTALAGVGNNALSSFSLAQGYVTETTLRGQVAFSGTGFNFPFERGYCQQSTLVANREAILTTGLGTVLSLDGTGVTNLIIPNGNNRVWNVVASWSAIVTNITGTATGVSVGDIATECNLFAFKKIAGISSIVGTVTNVASHNDTSMATAAMGYTAGASQELVPTFSAPIFAGGGSVTIRVVLKLMLTEVAYV